MRKITLMRPYSPNKFMWYCVQTNVGLFGPVWFFIRTFWMCASISAFLIIHVLMCITCKCFIPLGLFLEDPKAKCASCRNLFKWTPVWFVIDIYYISTPDFSICYAVCSAMHLLGHWFLRNCILLDYIPAGSLYHFIVILNW